MNDEELIDALRRAGHPKDATGGLLHAAADAIERLNYEIMGYQVRGEYEKGHEHGTLAGLKHAKRAIEALAAKAQHEGA